MEPELQEGWVATALAEEHPGLRLRWLDVPDVVVTRRSSAGLKERLRVLSSRINGPEAILLRGRPVPQAYRVFFRSVGMDPDASRTPIEAAAVERLVRGGYKSDGPVRDALLLGLVETGVPLWALDAGAADGPLGLRESAPGETLGTGELANGLPAGRLVVADAQRPVAVLFGDVAPSHAPDKTTTAVRVFSLQVAGVPELHVEEALWSCAEALRSG